MNYLNCAPPTVGSGNVVQALRLSVSPDVVREQAKRAIEHWLARDWPRIKKMPAASKQASC